MVSQKRFLWDAVVFAPFFKNLLVFVPFLKIIFRELCKSDRYYALLPSVSYFYERIGIGIYI